MSKINVKVFFKFCKVKVIQQVVNIAKKTLKIKVKANERYTPVCHECENKTKEIRPYNRRTVSNVK